MGGRAMSKQQTAVDFLVEDCVNINQSIDYIPLSKFADIVKISKQIEKLQIVKAYQQGQLNTLENTHKSSDEYYYETYGGVQ
jgi:hypothetical protein